MSKRTFGELFGSSRMLLANRKSKDCFSYFGIGRRFSPAPLGWLHLYSGLSNSTKATLVDSRFDHEACGLGLVARLDGKAQHDILRLALTALGRLSHRGAVAADHKS